MVADFNAGSIEGSLDINLSPFEAGLAKARAEAQAFEARDYTATVHVRTDGDAPALGDLGDSSATTNFKADTSDFDRGAARVVAERDAIDGSDAEVNVKADTGLARMEISGLMALIAGLGPALIPLGAAAAATLPALATGAGAAVAAIAPLALGISAVTGAVKNLAAEEKAETAAKQANSAQAKVQAQAQEDAALQIIAATDALANARRLADNQAITSAESVKNARQSLADTEQTVAQREIAATNAVLDAEYRRQQAIEDELDAQQRLNDAREEAERALERSANRAIDANLDLQQSQIDLTEAQQAYADALADPATTAQELQQIELNLAKAQQRVVEATDAARYAQEDNNEAQQAGVDGSPAVLAAQEALLDAQHAAQEATEAVTDAINARTQAEIDGAEQITAAQQRVKGAVREAAMAQQSSAYSIVQAQRAVDAAYRNSERAAQSSSDANAQALQKIRDDLAKTSPAVLNFAEFVRGDLTDAFHDAQNAAAEGLLPGVQEALETLLPYMDEVNGFLRDMGGVIGDIASDAADALTSPFWRDFFDWFGGEAKDSVAGMANAFGDILTGIAGLMQTFAPVTEMLGGGILDLTEKFKDWATATDEDSGVQKFMHWMQENGPEIWDAIEKVAGAVEHIVEALAPVGMLDLTAIGYFADAISAIPTPILTALGVSLSIIVPLLWSMSKLVMLATMIRNIGIAFGILAGGETAAMVPLLPIIAAFAAIVAVVALVALGIYELVEHWDAVKGAMEAVGDFLVDVFKGAWDMIGDAIGFVKDHIELFLLVLGPLGLAIDAVIEVFQHWSEIVDFVQDIFGEFIDFVASIPGRIVDIFQDAGQWLLDAGENIIQGLWDGIQWVWDKLWWWWYVELPQDVIGVFADAIDWLYNAGKDVMTGLWNGLKDVWGDVTGWLSKLNPASWFNDINVELGHAEVNLLPMGRMVMHGLQRGMAEGWEDVTKYLNSLDPSSAMDPSRLSASARITTSLSTTTGETNAHLAEMNRLLNDLTGAQSESSQTLGKHLSTLVDELSSVLADAQEKGSEKYAEAVGEAFDKSQSKATREIITAVRTG